MDEESKTKRKSLVGKDVCCAKSKLYKVDPNVLKFLKRKNAEEKLRRKFPEKANRRNVVRVKFKRAKESPNKIQDGCHAKMSTTTGTSIQGGNLQSKKKLGDSLILQIADNKPYGVKSLSHHLEHNSLQPSHQILSKLSNIKGNVHEIIQEVNSVLKGQGQVRFVAVKGSGQVSRITEKTLVPVPSDDSALEEYSETDEEVDDFSTDVGQSHTLHGIDLQTASSSSGQCMTVQGHNIANTEESMETDEFSDGRPLSKMPFKCQRCKSKPFCTQLELDLHMSCHVTDGPDLLIYRCPEASCSTERRCYPRMVEHFIAQHPRYEKMLQGTQTYSSVAGSFKCQACSLEFKLKINLQNHIKKMHGGNSGKVFSKRCDRCGIEFSNITLADFNQHREECCYEYRCSLCDYSTNRVKNIEMHFRLHTGEGFQCDVCQKTFGSKTRLNVHSKIHTEDRPKFVCDLCRGEFAHRDALKKHRRRIHEEVEKLKCSQCEYETKMQADLNKHMLFVHRKVFHCTFENCKFQTNSQKFWNEHLTYHKPENVFSCSFEDCYYKAETESKVLSHLNGFHKISAKHQCTMCSKFFFKKTQLMRHMVSHTNEKVYKCVECKESFVSHSSYYKHRHKTGHDEGRQGIVSVPQNVQIVQYNDSTGNDLITSDGKLGDTSVSTPQSIQIVQYSDSTGSDVIHVGNHLDKTSGSVPQNIQIIQCSENTGNSVISFRNDLEQMSVSVPKSFDIPQYNQHKEGDVVQVINTGSDLEHKSISIAQDIQIIPYSESNAHNGVNLESDFEQRPVSVPKTFEGSDLTEVSEVISTGGDLEKMAASVSQNIEMIEYTDSTANAVTNTETGPEQDAMVIYRNDERSDLPICQESEKVSENIGQQQNMQIISVQGLDETNTNIHGQEMNQVNQDTKIIYMDDCDEITKALIVKELQKNYIFNVDQLNVAGETIPVNYNNAEDTGQFVTVSESKNVSICGGQTVVLYDPSVHGTMPNLKEVQPTAPGLQMGNTSENQYKEIVDSQSQSHGHKPVDFDVELVVNKDDIEEGDTSFSSESLNVEIENTHTNELC